MNNIRDITQLAKWGKGALRTTVWSPDGRLLAIGTSLGVYLYDGASLQELKFISMNESASKIAFSPDGEILATGNKSVRLWDTTTGAQIATLEGEVKGWISYLAFSPGGTTIAALGIDGSPGDPPSKLFVWDAINYETRYIKEADGGGHGNSFTFSPDGRTIVYRVSGFLTFIRASNGEKLAFSLDNIDSTTTIFTPDGKSILVGSDLIDIESKKVIKTLNMEPQFDTAILTPDGKTLILENVWDNQINDYVTQLWDIDRGEVRLSIPNSGYFEPNSLRPDGLELTTLNGNLIEFWNVKTGELTRTVEWESRVTAIAFGMVSFDEYKQKLVLITTNRAGLVRLLDPESGRVLKEYQGSHIPIYDVTVHPNGDLLGLSVVDEKAKTTSLITYSLSTGQQNVAIAIPIKNPYDALGTWGIAFSQDGEAIAAKLSPFMYIQAWIWRSSEKMLEPYKKTWLNALDFGSVSNGHIIWIDYKNNQILDKNTGVVLSTFTNADDVGMCSEEEHYMVSSDYRYFVLGCDWLDIKVWDMTEQRQKIAFTEHRPSVGDGWIGNITGLGFSPYGYLLASSGYDRTIRFWNVDSGQLLLTISEHTCAVNQIVFSPDGRFLASTSCDGTVRLWGLQR